MPKTTAAPPSKFRSLLGRGSLESLKTAIAASQKGSQRDDEGFYKITTDKAGNGSAIIRFLPAPVDETVPFAMFYKHAFQGPNGWYIEKSRTSLNEPDPLSEYNSRLWNTGVEENKKQASRQSRKKTFVSNILVLQDKANPENEGKVFLFRYGTKIFEKIQKATAPDFEDVTPFDPFSVLEGANFRLRQKKQQNFPNYDDSAFEAPTPLFNGDEKKLEEIFEQLKPIAALTAPDQFKSYDELKKKLDRVMGFDTASYLNPTDAAAGHKPVPQAGRPKAEHPLTPANVPQPAAAEWTPPSIGDDASDDDLDLDKFEDD